jgi:hypothetical protein
MALVLARRTPGAETNAREERRPEPLALRLLHFRIATKRLLVAGGVAVLIVFAGRGSSTPRPDPARVAQLVAETKTLCSSIAHRAHPSPTQQHETQHRLAALTKALSHAAAYLPAGRSLNEAHAKRRALEAEVSKLTKLGAFLSGRTDYIVERFYRCSCRSSTTTRRSDSRGAWGGRPSRAKTNPPNAGRHEDRGAGTGSAFGPCPARDGTG